MTLFPVLVDVYHKEQLLTKDEADKVASYAWGWEWRHIAVTKDANTSTRIADILDKYGFNDVAQRIRGKCVLLSVCMNTVQDLFGKAQLS